MGKVQVYQEPNRGEHLIGKTGILPVYSVQILATLLFLLHFAPASLT